MSYWISIPTAVRKSKRLSAEEKDLYYEITDRVSEGGYCKATNKELAKELGVSEKTITTRLASLIAKGFANITQNRHKHERWIYLKSPGQQSEEPKPTDETLQDKRRRLEESFKQAIVFGDISFNVLIQKLKESPYLEKVKDNNIQFILTSEQMEFLVKFKKRYPGKAIDCQVSCYPNVEYQRLISSIDDSLFLQKSENLSLKWCLENAEKIIKGDYKSSLLYNQEFYKNFTGRECSAGELNSQFQNIDDIVI